MSLLFPGALAIVPTLLAAPPTVSITFDPAARAEPASGRLVLYLVRDGAPVRGDPADGPFWEAPQPMFGIDVQDLAPGTPIAIDDAATSFPAPWSALPPGRYRAQAVLDLHRENSSWRREPGNLFSGVIAFAVPREGDAAPLRLTMHRVVPERAAPQAERTELFEIRSRLLSDFYGREATLRAGVILPAGYDPADTSRRYAAVYEVPGFGGDSSGAFQKFHPYRSGRDPGSPWQTLRENAFWIVLDPESPNGHTLFADSDNNGPWGRALTEELIPALEQKYPLAADAKARLLRGHSSGGWSTLWLAITYPGTFGACWSSSPDPVDFRRFQLADIYSRPGVYREDDRPDAPGGAGGFDPASGELPSYRRGGKVHMTIREENLMEEVMGPDNTSGQQWDSWFAVFGPRNERGNPAALFDPATGRIDPAVAEHYRRYDLVDLLKREPAKYGALFKERVRLIVGAEDNFYLNEAVALLQDELENIQFIHLPEGGHGTLRIVPGRDHGTVFASPEVQNIPAEMVEHLRRAGLIR